MSDVHDVAGQEYAGGALILEGHRNSVSGISWCPRIPAGENEILATSVLSISLYPKLALIGGLSRSSYDHSARLWDVTTGSCLKVFTNHKRAIYTLSFSPNGRWLATGSGDGWLHIYDVKVRTLCIIFMLMNLTTLTEERKNMVLALGHSMSWHL